MKSENWIKMAAIVVIIAVVAISAFNMVSGYVTFGSKIDSNKDTTTTIQSDGEVQKVKLSMTGYTYLLEPSTLKMNVPVEMTVDLSTVTGCMQDIVIKDFNVRKYVSQGDNIIRFTPTKEGTFGIACSMNMGRGVFSVTNDGGATSSSTQQLEAASATLKNAPSGGTCGGSSGGSCGCGMMR